MAIVQPPPSDVDENGVDRAQIRAMLALTPEEASTPSTGTIRAGCGRRAALPLLRATLDELKRRSSRPTEE